MSAAHHALAVRTPTITSTASTAPPANHHVNYPVNATTQDFQLPRNVRATTDAAEAISGASYAVHAVPVQHSRAFLSSIRDYLAKDVPIICVSKGLEVGTGCMMSEVIPSALGRRQPAVFLSGPSFAKEVRLQRVRVDGVRW